MMFTRSVSGLRNTTMPLRAPSSSSIASSMARGLMAILSVSRTWRSSWSTRPGPSTFTRMAEADLGRRLRVRFRSSNRTACRSSLSMAPLIEERTSAVSCTPTRTWSRNFKVISAMRRCFSAVRMTWTSNRSRRTRVSFRMCFSVYLRKAGVISIWRPVKSSCMGRPPRISVDGRPTGRGLSSFHPALVSARNSHVLAVLRYRSTRHVNTLLAQPRGDLLVGPRLCGVFFLNHLLDEALEVNQRGSASGRPLHGLREEISKLVDALRRIGVLVGDRPADGGRMDPDLLGHFFDHHGPQMVDAFVEKIPLPADDYLAHLDDRLLALLDILDELNGGNEPLFDVIAHVAAGTAFFEHPPVTMAQPQLGQPVFIHRHLIIIPHLDDGDVRLDQTGLVVVVALARARVELADDLDRALDRLDGAVERPRQLPVLLV